MRLGFSARNYGLLNQPLQFSPSVGGPWTPLSEASLRGSWTPDGKRDGSAGAITNGESLASWLDAKATYDLDTLGSAAPTGVTSGSGVAAAFNATDQSIGTGAITVPTDAAGTVAILCRTPGNVLAARDFDIMLCFSHLTTTNQQILFCVRRITIPGTALQFGFVSHNSGAGISGWRATTTTLAIDTWYRVVYTLSGSALTISIDGVAQSLTQTDSAGPTVGKFLDTVSCNSISIGARHWPSSAYAEFWGGRIDQVHWFSSVLGAGSLTSLDTFLAERQALL